MVMNDLRSAGWSSKHRTLPRFFAPSTAAGRFAAGDEVCRKQRAQQRAQRPIHRHRAIGGGSAAGGGQGDGNLGGDRWWILQGDFEFGEFRWCFFWVIFSEILCGFERWNATISGQDMPCWNPPAPNLQHEQMCEDCFQLCQWWRQTNTKKGAHMVLL